MSLSATRPPWLSPVPELEQILAASSLSIPLASLRSPRNYSCIIVGHLLQHILAGLPSNPSNFELDLAHEHLAIDVARILASWASCGERETLASNKLVVSGVQTLDVRPIIPAKRRSPSNDSNLPDDPTRDFRCPFNIRDPHDRLHAECAGKRFPNPRKLKEHIWRFTKPFKCPKCGEGFGREKTKAIHCDQRKVKCSRLDGGGETEYEGSAAQWRDRKIEAARSTKECLDIFEEYERRLQEGTREAPPLHPHEEMDWAQPAQLTYGIYPSTPATTPQSPSFHSPTSYQHSPTSPTYGHSTSSPTFYSVPRIVVSTSQEDGSAYHGARVQSPIAHSPQHFQQQQQMMMQQRQQQHNPAQVFTVQSNGYGSFPPFTYRLKTN